MINSQLLTGGEEKNKLGKIKETLNLKIDIEKPQANIFHLIPEKSIGIEEVRKLNSFLNKKPFGEEENIAIIHNAEKLTIPSQNALLKTLEEPPNNSFIFLLTDNPNSLLETILSRVKVVRIKPNKKERSTAKKEEKTEELLKKITNSNPSQRIALTLEIGKSKAEVEKIIRNLISFSRKAIKQENKNFKIEELESILLSTEVARKMLEANVNFHLVVENLVLNLP